MRKVPEAPFRRLMVNLSLCPVRMGAGCLWISSRVRDFFDLLLFLIIDMSERND